MSVTPPMLWKQRVALGLGFLVYAAPCFLWIEYIDGFGFKKLEKPIGIVFILLAAILVGMAVLSLVFPGLFQRLKLAEPPLEELTPERKPTSRQNYLNTLVACLHLWAFCTLTFGWAVLASNAQDNGFGLLSVTFITFVMILSGITPAIIAPLCARKVRGAILFCLPFFGTYLLMLVFAAIVITRESGKRLHEMGWFYLILAAIILLSCIRVLLTKPQNRQGCSRGV